MKRTTTEEAKNLAENASAPPRRHVAVFHLLDSFQIGGTETQAVELARRLDARGDRVTVGCLQREGPLLERLAGSNVEIVEFRPKGGINSPSGLREMLRLARFLRRERFAAVHAHDLWSNLLAVPAARLAGVPVIIASQRDLSHGAWYTRRKRQILRLVQRWADLLLVNSREIEAQLVREDSFPPGKIRVIYNAVDVDRFASARRNRSAVLPGVPEEALVIVLVGNMHTDVKGQPWAMEALARISGRFPRALLAFVGDGACRPEFEKRAAGLGINDRILFLGRRSDIPEVLACCDIGLSSSTAEGMPNAVLEYMAAGLPVVATAVGGSTELVHDGDNGHLVPARDSEALSRALWKVLEEPVSAKEMGEAGRALVRRKFSFDGLMEEMSAIYERRLVRGSRR